MEGQQLENFSSSGSVVIFPTFLSFQPRQTVLTAAGSIGQASGELLRQIGENETDERFQVKLPWDPLFFRD